MNIIPKISADFFSSKGNYKNYNARICMRIWNNAILFFFLEFFKTYISLLVHIVLYKRRRGGGKKTISRLLSFYRQNNDDSIFFFVSTSNLYDALKRDATSIGINISKDSNSW